MLPTAISRFRSAGDNRTAELLETVVYPEEITHSAAGIKWFKYLCFRTSQQSQNALPFHGCLSSQITPAEEIVEERVDSIDDDLTRSPDQSTSNMSNDELENMIRTFHATVRTHF